MKFRFLCCMHLLFPVVAYWHCIIYVCVECAGMKCLSIRSDVISYVVITSYLCHRLMSVIGWEATFSNLKSVLQSPWGPHCSGGR